MTETLAVCDIQDAMTANLVGWMNVLNNFFSTPPNQILFSKNSNSLPNALLLDHVDGWQLLIRNDGTNLLCSIDPGGTITNLNTTPAGSVSFSNESIVINPTNCGNRMHIACYPDAILVGLKHVADNYWQQGLHAGKICTPINASDPTVGIDGFGILAGSPAINPATGTNIWLVRNTTTGTTTRGRMRIGQTDWAQNTRSEVFLGNADILEQVRFVPFGVAVGSSATTSNNPIVGITKYLRRYKSSEIHRTTIPASNLSDQAFLVFSNSTSTSNFCCLWSKSVTP